MWFEDDQDLPMRRGKFQRPSSASLSWLSVSRLRPFGLFGPDNAPAIGVETAEGYSNKLDAIKRASSARNSLPPEDENARMFPAVANPTFLLMLTFS